MRNLILSILLLLNLGIFAQDMEVLVLSTKGIVSIEEPGKEALESVKLDTRYGQGIIIKTNENSSVELLLQDNSIMTIEGNATWTIGQDFSEISLISLKIDDSSNLWELLTDLLDTSNNAIANNTQDKLDDTTADPNVDNSDADDPIKVLDKKLENTLLSDIEKRDYSNALKSIRITDEFATIKLKAMAMETFSQFKNAEENYNRALDLAQTDEIYNQTLDYLISMLNQLDNQGLADKYTSLKK